jgi:hypothetical protein
MSLGDWFNETVTKVTGKSPQEHADNLKAAANKVVSVNPVATDQGVRDALKLPSDGANITLTGGRRRKTRGRKNRKTRRRKH